MHPLRSGCLTQQRLASRAHFELDNRTLYDEFKPLIVDGPGWSFITVRPQLSSHASSQLTLRLQVQPTKTVQKVLALQIMSLSALTAHIELMDLDEPVSESKKVTDFLEGIRDDSKLTTGKSIVLGDPAKLGNVEECRQ
ncbi:hypothetical protein MHU86_669 [Fragilaria crotonensis]|nr:hypothetical protein MHU86_669 [Fragilaria crotonensis]